MTKQLYTVMGTTGKEFGEVIEGVMTSGLMLDLLKGERRIPCSRRVGDDA